MCVDCDALGAVKTSPRRKAAVSLVASFSIAGDMVENAVSQVHPPYAMTFSQGNPHSALFENQRTWTEDWIVAGELAVNREATLGGASDRFDYMRMWVDSADAMVANICNVNGVVCVKGDAMRLPEMRANRRTAVATETGTSRTGDRRDDARLSVDAADDVILHFDNKHIAVGVESDLIWFIQLGFGGWSTIAYIAPPATTGRRSQFAGRKIEASHSVVANLRNIQSAIRTDLDSKGVADVHGDRRPRCAVILRVARACDSLNGRVGGRRRLAESCEPHY